MFPLLVAFIFPSLAAADVIPILYTPQFSVTPSAYNPNASFELKCTVNISPEDVEYTVNFIQNGNIIGEYDMKGKEIKLWTNKTSYITPKLFKYPVFITTITVNREKTPGQYMCQLLHFQGSVWDWTIWSSNSSVWNTNKSTGLGVSVTVWTTLAMATALFVYL